jgi:phage/plasmid-associated DNA primase
MLDDFTVSAMYKFDLPVKSTGNLDIVNRRARSKCGKVFNPKPKVVNFKNGTLDLNTLKLYPHDKNDDLLYCLDYDYQEVGTYPKTLSFYESSLCIVTKDSLGNTTYTPDYHAIQAVMALFGLALIGDAKSQQMVVMIGKPRAGKSTIMRHGNSLCGNATGNSNTAPEIRYGSFAGDDLFSHELEGKRARYTYKNYRLVCGDEIHPTTFRNNENIIKDMSAHSGVPMRGMNKDEEANNIWLPKLLLSANEKPQYADTSNAIGRRVVYLSAPRERHNGELDLSLFDKLLPERGAFVRDCIMLAKDLLLRGYYPESSSMKNESRDTSVQGNTLKAFIQDRCVLELGAREHSDTLFAALKTYREQNGNSSSYSKTKMNSDLVVMHASISMPTNGFRVNGKFGRGFLNIRLKTVEEIENSCTKSEPSDELLSIELVTKWGAVVPHNQANGICGEKIPTITVDIKKELSGNLTEQSDVTPVASPDKNPSTKIGLKKSVETQKVLQTPDSVPHVLSRKSQAQKNILKLDDIVKRDYREYPDFNGDLLGE